MELSSSDPGVGEHIFLCELLGHGRTNSIFNTWLWVKRYNGGCNCGRNATNAELLRTSKAGGVSAGHATERHFFLGGA